MKKVVGYYTIPEQIEFLEEFLRDSDPTPIGLAFSNQKLREFFERTSWEFQAIETIPEFLDSLKKIDPDDY